METSMDIIVRPTELDVLGHVNNVKYLEYLERKSAAIPQELARLFPNI